MKSVILSAIAVVAVVGQQLSSRNISSWNNSFNLTVDWQEIEEIGQSISQKWNDYSIYERKWTQTETNALKQALQNTYKETLTKLNMDYADLIAPLVDHVGDAFDNSTMKGECEAPCAVKCWNSNKFDKENSLWLFGFNRTCFRSCGCEFKLDKKLDKKTSDMFTIQGELIKKDLAELVKYGQDLATQAKNKVIPALQRYEQKQNELKNEYLKTVRATAVQDLGCDSTCVNRCTNGYTTCFFALSSCLSGCSCDAIEDVIDLNAGRVNVPQMMLYSKGSVRAIEALVNKKDL